MYYEYCIMLLNGLSNFDKLHIDIYYINWTLCHALNSPKPCWTHCWLRNLFCQSVNTTVPFEIRRKHTFQFLAYCIRQCILTNFLLLCGILELWIHNLCNNLQSIYDVVYVTVLICPFIKAKNNHNSFQTML